MNYAIILAAGKGSRMNKEEAKCASLILGKPMINYILDELEGTKISTIIPILGYKKEMLETILENRKNIKIATQQEQLGTAHAVMMAKDLIDDLSGNTIIVCGDMPLINSDIINKLVSYHKDNKNDITLATTILDNPFGYGRVIRKEEQLYQVIEQTDATDKERLINEINTGLYCVKTSVLFNLLDKINNTNSKNEYYLTDIIKIAHQDNLNVKALKFLESNLFTGINDLYNLSIVEDYIKNDILKKHMLNGVRITNPQSVIIEADVKISSNATIYPNTIITNKSIIEHNVIIGPNTTISNSTIKSGASVTDSVVSDSIVGSNTTVGPFANIRLNSNIKDNVRIGNFVELKKANIDNGAKMAHLAYVGDANVGSNTNIGCGVITANYDGKNKHVTNIGSNVFVGSNTTLIAPITVEDSVMIAAGSTISKDLQEDDFVIARSKEVIKPNYASKYLKKKK